MGKEIECPGKKLINLVTGVLDFENLDREPGAGEKYTIMIGDETLDEFLKRDGIDIYKVEVVNYKKKQNILSELCKYGKTKKEALKGLREHVKTCQACSNKYLNYITLRANYLINLKDSQDDKDTISKSLIEVGTKFAKKGLFALLKEEDKRFLGLLD